MGDAGVAEAPLGAGALTPFDAAGRALAGATVTSELQARGTLRLVCKDAGLDPSTATRAELVAALESGLEDALAKRRLRSGDRVVKLVIEAVRAAQEISVDGYELFRDLD